jgi:hypothetical protein
MGFTTTLLDVNYNIEREPYPTRTHSGGEKKKEKKRFPKKTFISFTPRMGSYTEGGVVDRSRGLVHASILILFPRFRNIRNKKRKTLNT